MSYVDAGGYAQGIPPQFVGVPQAHQGITTHADELLRSLPRHSCYDRVLPHANPDDRSTAGRPLQCGGLSPLAGRVSAARAAACVLIWILAAGAGDGTRAQALPPTDAGYVHNQLIVRLRDGGSGAALTALFSSVGAIGVTFFETVDGLVVLTLPEGMDVTTARSLAKALDGVAYAEPNYILTTGVTPNDPSFGSLWGLHNTGLPDGTADADIDAPEAWDMVTGSAGVVVAVLDTGIDYTHPDLTANMFRNEAECLANGVDDDLNGYVDDCHGIDTANGDSNPFDDNVHGTHVAGTIGAAGNNGVGVVGVNWQVKLMPCKFLGANGKGDTADAITCLEYVAAMKDRGVNVVATNNSWGGIGFSQALYDAVEVQQQKGILFIAAAGNSAADNDSTPDYPASLDLPNVVAVAATTRTDARSSFSNYGRRTVQLGAPGSDIRSTTPGNTYNSMNGTSMASPHVAGVAALLKAQNPSRDWRAIRNLILSGGDTTGAMSGVTVTGKRLNAFGSVNCSGATVFSRLKPIADVVFTTTGSPITISALNIECAAGRGNVAVGISGGGTLTLVDDGVAPDQAAGDGIYSASYTPAVAASRVLTFPDSSTVTVHALSPTSYTVQSTAFAYRTITGTNLNLGDDTSAVLAAPFAINFGGGLFNTLYVSSNGAVNVTGPNNIYDNAPLPSAKAESLVAALWDDLKPLPNTDANVFWAVTGLAPNRELVIEWRNVGPFDCPSLGGTFQVVFFEGLADILFNYADTIFGGACASADRGAEATVGVQTSPSVARQYSHNSASVNDGTALLWTVLGQPGTFTDDPLIAGATPVRALHITELRARIDTQRARVALEPVIWTDDSLVAGVTTAKAQHLLEMRSAVIETFQAANLTAPSFTDALMAGQTVIRAVHIAELRAAVVTLEMR
jgi:subtilisin family serine protease